MEIGYASYPISIYVIAGVVADKYKLSEKLVIRVSPVYE
jgi:hypothetical protein